MTPARKNAPVQAARSPDRDENGGPPGGSLHDGEFRRRVLFVAATSLAVGLVLIGFRFVAETVVLVFAGLLLATLLHAPTRWLHERTGLPELPALVLIVVGLVCLLAGGAALFGYQVAGQADLLIRSVSEAASETRASLVSYGWGRRLLQMTGSGLSWARAFGGGVISGTPHLVFAFAVVFFVGVYVAARPETYRAALLRLIADRRRKRADDLIDVMEETLHRWLLGQLASMGMVAVLTTLGLWFVGAPFPLPLGLLAGALTFVPNVGPTVALIPAVLLALVESASLALLVVGVYTGIQIIESYLLTPLVQRRMVYLPPAVTITAQFLLWMLAGTLGLVVATPLVALILAAARDLDLDGGGNGTFTDRREPGEPRR